MIQRYSQLCPVAFGTGAVSTTGDVARELGLNKVLVVTDESDILCYDTIERIFRWLPVAAEEPDNLEARENLALASNNAGIAFNDAMVHLGHAIAHAMGATFHIPHGIACALVTPVIIELTAPVYPDKVKKIGTAMGLTIKASEPQAIGQEVAGGLRRFQTSWASPPCLI
jgi:alcohol dehydrogenase